MNNLKGIKVHFGSWFQSVVTWSCCFLACGEVAHHGGSMRQGELFTSWWPRSRERKGPGPNIPFKGPPPVTLLPPTRPNLLKVTQAGDQAFTTFKIQTPTPCEKHTSWSKMCRVLSPALWFLGLLSIFSLKFYLFIYFYDTRVWP
jgi:hypothetical protein